MIKPIKNLLLANERPFVAAGTHELSELLDSNRRRLEHLYEMEMDLRLAIVADQTVTIIRAIEGELIRRN